MVLLRARQNNLAKIFLLPKKRSTLYLLFLPAKKLCGKACAAVAGCVIVADGFDGNSAEVYDEVMDRWFRLSRDLPHDGSSFGWMGCALLL